MTRKYNTRANKNRQTNKQNTHTHTHTSATSSSNTMTNQQTMSQNWHKLLPPPTYTPKSYTHHTHVTNQQMHVTTPQNTFAHTPILTANTPIFTAQPPNYTTHTSILANTPIFTAQPPNYATHTPIYTTNTPIFTQTVQNTIDCVDERQFLENMELALQFTAEKQGLNINAREFQMPAEYVPTPSPEFANSPTPTYASQGHDIDRTKQAQQFGQHPATPVQQLPQLPAPTAAGQGHGGVIRYHQRSHQGLSTPAPSHPSSGPAGGLHEVAWKPVTPGPPPTALLPPTSDSRGQHNMDSNDIIQDPYLYYNLVLTVPIAIDKRSYAVSMKFP